MSSTEPRVEVFTGPGCAQCAAAKGLLDRRGLAYTEVDVSSVEGRAEFGRRLPRARSIPQLFVDGEHLGGLEDLRLAAERGRLDTL